MTNEEIVIEIQTGRTELLPELWESCRRFVSQQAYKWARAWAPNESYEAVNSLQEDLYQTGYLAVEEAARRYKPDTEALFLTYLGFYLKKHFKRTIAEYTGWSSGTLERAQKAITVESLNRPILNEGSDDAIELGDQIADPSDFVEESTERMFLESLHNELEGLLNRLDQIKSEAIRLHFYKGMTYEQIGQAKGITAEAVQWRISTGIREIRNINLQEKCLEVYIDRHTDFYRRVGVEAFQNTGFSAVELICIKREEMLRSIQAKIKEKEGKTKI